MADAKRYVRFCRGLNDKGILVEPDALPELIEENSDKDCYASTYYYNEEQLKRFKETGSIRGIRDTVSDKIWFDFDSATNPELARQDAITLVKRLKDYRINDNNIQVFFSGNKGFEVTVKLNRLLTPEQIESIAINKFGIGLNTLDHSLYDTAQIFRLPYTKHQKTGLYKIPIEISQLKSLDITKIKQLASNLDTAPEFPEYENAEPSSQFFEVPQQVAPTKVKVSSEPLEFDLSRRPGHWKDYKWALLHAVGLKSDERHEALMRIAATCKGLGYSEDITRAFCLTFDENFQRETGKPPVEDLDHNILSTVFGPYWEGGQYSYKSDIWLQKYCERIGLVPNQTDDIKIVDVHNIVDAFDSYALNFEKNIIKTGIKAIDDNVLFLTATHNGLLGQPGSGKTSLAIQWLKHVSAQGEHGLFYSLDMAKEIIGGKLIQSVEGCSFKEAVNLRVQNPTKYKQVIERIKEQYKNVSFNFTSGTTVSRIKEDIKAYEETTGNKIRLLIVDYLECLQGEYADPTANSGLISNQMKDLANELKVCSVMLLQTQKHSTAGGDVSEPLLSMKQIKGSSLIEQSASVIMTLWRPGYSPEYADRDKFLSTAIVKNRFGGLWTGDFTWNGKRGEVGQALTDEQKWELDRLLEDKKEAKKAKQLDDEWN